MAETVASMASSMLSSAIGLAASAASNEMSLLLGVRNEIWFIKDELKTMQAFLRAAEVRKEKDELVKVWAGQVRDLAYDIQDCLEEFAVHVRNKNLLRLLMKLRHRHRIAVQIRSLKLRVEEVSNRNTRYNLINSVPSSTMDDSTSNMEVVRYQAAHLVDEAELFGFAGPKKEVLELISSSASAQVQVIWIIGAGGLGKTTLAKKVYESSEITANFTCRAWITVSQSYSVKELLKEMISHLLSPESMKKLLEQHTGLIINEGHLADHLKDGLKERRYFLVLDDLWTVQAWDCIKPTFWGGNEKGSRVVVTTRNGNVVGASSSSPLVYYLKTLEEEDATKLLLRKTRRSLDDIKKDQISETFAKIIKKCGGLPLAILTIGGLLATNDVKDWENLYSQLPSELETNPSLEAMKKVVMMSYNSLPSHLKPCFLYLSIFPEDYEIKRRRLINRWIAEGFVWPRFGMPIEDVGEIYLNELIDRSMVQASRLNIEGKAKRCRVHDIIRDITVSVSREENFVYSTGDDVAGVVEENFRHVACHDHNNPTVGMDWRYVRSLTVFGERPMEPGPSLCSPELRMLRALDLENAGFKITQKDIKNIGLLQHLKYVNARKFQTFIYALPRSIGKLQGLQALDIRGSYITTIPSEISKLLSLRSLRCSKRSVYFYFDLENDPKSCVVETLCLPRIFTPLVDDDDRNRIIAELHMAYSSRWSKTNGVKFPRGICNLKELQVLDTLDMKRTSRKAIEELGDLRLLRKLGVTSTGATREKYMTFCKALEKLSALRSLSIDTDGTLEWLGSICSPPPELWNLRLEGYIGETPDWFSRLTKLVKVTLTGSKLKEDKTMEILGALPNLMLFFLWESSYVGKELVFREGAFPKLKKLQMCRLDELREVRFEKDASPHMENIEIAVCKLTSGIIGINHLPRLKEIFLSYRSEVARLDVLQDEVKTHPNQCKLVLRLFEDPSEHDLGDVFFEAMESLPDHVGEGSQAITVTASDS